MLWINIMWGLLNLLPVWPLDGGQITETVLSQVNPYDGRRWTHIVSLVAGGADRHPASMPCHKTSVPAPCSSPASP